MRPIIHRGIGSPVHYALRDDEIDLTGRSIITNSIELPCAICYRVWLEGFRTLRVIERKLSVVPIIVRFTGSGAIESSALYARCSERRNDILTNIPGSSRSFML